MRSFHHILLSILVSNFFLPINWTTVSRLSTYTAIWNSVSISLKYFFCFYWNKQNNNNPQNNIPQRQFKLKWITWKYQCFDLKCLVYSQFPHNNRKKFSLIKCFMFKSTRFNYYIFLLAFKKRGYVNQWLQCYCLTGEINSDILWHNTAKISYNYILFIPKQKRGIWMFLLWMHKIPPFKWLIKVAQVKYSERYI